MRVPVPTSSDNPAERERGSSTIHDGVGDCVHAAGGQEPGPESTEELMVVAAPQRAPTGPSERVGKHPARVATWRRLFGGPSLAVPEGATPCYIVEPACFAFRFLSFYHSPHTVVRKYPGAVRQSVPSVRGSLSVWGSLYKS